MFLNQFRFFGIIFIDTARHFFSIRFISSFVVIRLNSIPEPSARFMSSSSPALGNSIKRNSIYCFMYLYWALRARLLAVSFFGAIKAKKKLRESNRKLAAGAESDQPCTTKARC